MAEQVGSIYYDITADTSKLIGQTRVVDRETQSMAASFNAVTVAIKLMAAALAIVKSAQFADDMRLMSARVQVAAGSLENASSAMRELQAISSRTQTEISANVQVFTRLNQSILQMGGTQRDTLRVTELLGMAVKVSGASAQESASAMTQFGQALGSGKLAGDELRSLLENAPYLMKQLADGIGVPVGALKSLGEQGKLTSDVVTAALQKAAGQIEADFKKMPQTLGAAMAVATDGAMRANEALDTLTGTSAALTGATKGIGTVFEMLAQQLQSATTEGDRLGRNQSVKTWAENTAIVLSYVVDAADLVTRAFRQAGAGIGGLAAAAGAAARGELKQSAEILRMMSADILKIGDAKYAGEKMRQAMRALGTTPEPDRLDRAALGGGPASKLKAPLGAGDGKGSQFDAAAYLAGLAAKTEEGLARVDVVEQEALRKNQALLAQGKISRQQAADAAVLIEQDAAQQRQDIMFKEATDNLLDITRAGEKEAAERKRLADQQGRGRTFAQGVVVADDPIAKLQVELEAKSALLTEYALLDQQNLQLYADAKVALERDTQAKIAEIVAKGRADQVAGQQQLLSSYGALFGGMADLAKTFEGEQSGTYRALFAVQKAFSIASALMGIQAGAAKAYELGWPAGAVAAASVLTQGASLLGSIKGASFGGGRQYGGPASAGSLYRVNETGRPEMFTGSNGAQYMLPTQNGNVTPAGQGGGGKGWTLIVQGLPANLQMKPAGVDERQQIVRLAVSEVANQFANNSGEAWSALRGSSNVQPRV